jgi:DNA-binding MarR family transcriptional regulator
MPDAETPLDPARLLSPGAAFLLSQLGEHSSRLWRGKVQTLGIDAQQLVVLRLVGATADLTQREVAKHMRLPPSRLVAVVDELESAGLLRRRRSSTDRRANALLLTGSGRRLVARAMGISREHEAALTLALNDRQRKELVRLLSRIAAAEDLPQGVMVNQPSR